MDIFTKNMLEFFHVGGVFIVDRGFRDCLAFWKKWVLMQTCQLIYQKI